MELCKSKGCCVQLKICFGKDILFGYNVKARKLSTSQSENLSKLLCLFKGYMYLILLNENKESGIYCLELLRDLNRMAWYNLVQDKRLFLFKIRLEAAAWCFVFFLR